MSPAFSDKKLKSVILLVNPHPTPLLTLTPTDYLKSFNQNELIRFLDSNKNYRDLAFFYL